MSRIRRTNPEEGEESGSGAFNFLLVGGMAAFGLYLWSRRNAPGNEPIMTESEEDAEEVEAEQPAAPSRATDAGRSFKRFRPRIAEGRAAADPRTAIPGTRFEPGPPGVRR